MSAYDLPDCRIGKVEGPFHRCPSGKFDSNGNPIMRRCPPYWVVRYMHGNVMHDAHFEDAGKAKEYWASLAPCDVISA